jgi:hypothetical protein
MTDMLTQLSTNEIIEYKEICPGYFQSIWSI